MNEVFVSITSGIREIGAQGEAAARYEGVTVADGVFHGGTKNQIAACPSYRRTARDAATTADSSDGHIKSGGRRDTAIFVDCQTYISYGTAELEGNAGGRPTDDIRGVENRTTLTMI